MKLSNKDLELIINWFEISQDSLSDEDLSLYDRIIEFLEDFSLEKNNEEDYLLFDTSE